MGEDLILRAERRHEGDAAGVPGGRVGKDLLAAFGARLGDLAGKRVLDIGCGLGGKTVAYAEANARVTGVDLSPENIAKCPAFARARGAPADFVAGDAGRLPFAGGSFDTVIANDSLEHFADPEGALRELARVLRPGGSLFLFFTPWESPLGSHLYDYIRTPWCHLVFPEWLIRALIGRELSARGVVDTGAEADRLMGEYHAELNRITIARYRGIVRAVAGLETVMEELRPAKFAFLRPLLRVPVAGRFLTGTVVAILRKAS